ncbi:MAG: Inositol 2-dehydrogenase [Verrucomicrobia subdivision 3 bacterium]|nr:Inositol 2-dehydrogenase [Limisphaerales bacterium]MCS1414026.1 Inositol 2-dehydrogenase [Limisphaerales bacterium]
MNDNNPFQKESATSRRKFIKSSSTAVVGGVLAPSVVGLRQSLSGQDSETVRVGLIGCGGRGSGAANQALRADSNVRLTAMGDVFPHRLLGSLDALKRAVGEKADVDPTMQFIGLNAYEKVINSGVDVVILTTPPSFRPQHIKAAIDAGKHVFCEKPMATDSPGLRSVMASVAKAKRKKLAIVAGFCWRYDYPRRALYQRIHDGEIGDIRSIYATYYTGLVNPIAPETERLPDMTDLAWQLKYWQNFVWLSGDSICEQAIHSVDKIAWAMKEEMPVKAVANGGRQIPAHGGNIYDHFSVVYEYKSGLRTHLGSRQIAGCYNENSDYIYGSKGTGLINGWSDVRIQGDKNWKYQGPKKDMYQVEHDELFASIRKGEPINDGDRMVTSCMMGLMGRMAAYTGKEVTWEDAMNSQEKLVPDNLEWDMELPVRPVARPGQTALI